MSPYDLKYLSGWCYIFCISLCSGLLDSSSAIIATKAAFLRFILCLWNSNLVCVWALFPPPHLLWNSVLVYVHSYSSYWSSFLGCIRLLLHKVHISGALRRILNIVHFELSKLLKPFTCKEVKLPILIFICIPRIIFYVCRFQFINVTLKNRNIPFVAWKYISKC